VHTRKGSLPGYNAQAVTTCEQVVVAAELTQDANDLQQLGPMLPPPAATLAAAGIPERPATLLADCGYWTIANLTQLPGAPELLIPPARHGRQGKPRKDGKPSESRRDGLRAAMAAKLASEQGKARYAKRKQTVEPVFGQIKEQQRARRFLRRGLRACAAEWKLLCGTTTCSSCGGPRPPGRSPRPPPPKPRPDPGRSSTRTTSAASRRGLPEVHQASGDQLMPPLSNTLPRVIASEVPHRAAAPPSGCVPPRSGGRW
jgi:hypothetical protein